MKELRHITGLPLKRFGIFHNQTGMDVVLYVFEYFLKLEWFLVFIVIKAYTPNYDYNYRSVGLRNVTYILNI